MKFYIHIVCIFCLTGLLSNRSFGQASESVLSSGQWIKMAVLDEGVYRINHEMLSDMGWDLTQVNPQYLAVYGNSYNGMLPQANNASRPDDLTENSIMVVGEQDGRFDAQDYLLFFGQSSNYLAYDKENDHFEFERNVYSDTAYYFLTLKNTKGLRISTEVDLPGSGSLRTSYSRLYTHELEINSIISSGRYWYGEQFNSSEKTHGLSFATKGAVGGSNIEVFVGVASRSTGTSSFEVLAEDTFLGKINMSPVGQGQYEQQADIKVDTFFVAATGLNLSDGLQLEINFEQSGTNTGFLDYAYVRVEQKLDLSKGSLIWFNTPGDTGYGLVGGSDKSRIWAFQPSGHWIQIQQLTSQNQLTMGASYDKYLAFEEGQELIPVSYTKIENQNLHGLSAADGIIVTHSNFKRVAQRLADFRTAHDGLLVEVVTVDQIFNEFSSGRSDVSAIRDFIKFQYEKHKQLQYVLMFGDGSFDYKDRSLQLNNYVPVYESRNSLHRLWSYASDDFFGFMEPDEGEWVESKEGDHSLELGIGRIPVQTNAQGEAVVNKIIRYHTNKLGYGKWRNNIAFIADDGDNNIHQEDADRLSVFVDTTQQALHINKIYLDAYPQTQNKSPQAEAAVLKALTKGNLIVNFTGHGNEGQLTHESIFDEFIIPELDNNILLPLFVTATCQFGNYDFPNRISGGEQMVLLPYGGAIALITATRPVYSNTNYEINEAFYFAAMQKENGQYKRLGDIFRETKNNSLVGAGNRNYALLGDPMMRLSFPEREVELTSINGRSIDEIDTLKAFGKYSVGGSIINRGALDDSFDGVVTMSVYDKPTKFQTLGDEEGSIKEIFEMRDVLLFQGDATVTGGRFDIDFVVPKNINYSFGPGKINFYAVNHTATIDAQGAFAELIVGGSEKTTSSDQTPPQISIFLNDTTSASGQVVDPSSVLLVRLDDESGINVSKAGFGNGLLLFLNDDEPVSVNEYYTASIDTYQQGWITYPLDNLKPGHYLLTIEASDIFNNYNSESIEFDVVEENGIQLSHVIHYPNPLLPVDDDLTVSFQHDRLGQDLLVYVALRDLQGSEVFSQILPFDNVSENTLQIVHNLSGHVGRLRKGIYIYRLRVQSKVDGSEGEVYRKIIISN